jgi:hypothetical protein
MVGLVSLRAGCYKVRKGTLMFSLLLACLPSSFLPSPDAAALDFSASITGSQNKLLPFINYVVCGILL